MRGALLLFIFVKFNFLLKFLLKLSNIALDFPLQGKYFRGGDFRNFLKIMRRLPIFFLRDGLKNLFFAVFCRFGLLVKVINIRKTGMILLQLVLKNFEFLEIVIFFDLNFEVCCLGPDHEQHSFNDIPNVKRHRVCIFQRFSKHFELPEKLCRICRLSNQPYLLLKERDYI